MVHVTVTGGVKTRQFNLSVYIVLVNGLSIVGIVLGVMNVFSGLAGYTILSHSGTPPYKIHHFRLLIRLLSVYKKGEEYKWYPLQIHHYQRITFHQG